MASLLVYERKSFAESAMVNDPAGSKIFKAKLTNQVAGL
jgi:hypothetical protein